MRIKICRKDPKPKIEFTACLRTPSPKDTNKIIAPIPILTPKEVKMVLNLTRFKLFKAIFKTLLSFTLFDRPSFELLYQL